MKFDVIVGNPPYQMSTGSASAQATPLYHKFVQQAKKMNPRYLTMIIPARWYSGGFGLDSFRDKMLNDKRIREIHDYPEAEDCFSGVQIKGGVCYFLWNRDNNKLCKVFTHEGGKIISESERPLLEPGLETFVRYNEAVPIIRKIMAIKEKSFSDIVSMQRPFGLPTNFIGYKSASFEGSIKMYANQKIGYITTDQIINHKDWLPYYKILMPKAVGSGNIRNYRLKPILAEKNTCCTETYIVLGIYENINTAENVISYIKTNFFHFLIGLRKITQDALRKVYSFVPMQDFSEPWTDEKLYAKYGLTQEEIAFIESMIRPMEVE
jgi:site-specific DNA-methyltransferase (adenine-specific)